MAQTKERVYSDAEIATKIQELGLTGWYLEEGWLRRKYNTDGWPQTLMAVNAIGYLCEAAYHHADLAVTWGKLWVKLQTHSAGGITDKDFESRPRRSRTSSSGGRPAARSEPATRRSSSSTKLHHHTMTHRLSVDRPLGVCRVRRRGRKPGFAWIDPERQAAGPDLRRQEGARIRPPDVRPRPRRRPRRTATANPTIKVYHHLYDRDRHRPLDERPGRKVSAPPRHLLRLQQD